VPEGKYHHLTYEQRCQIYTLKKRGDAQDTIAGAIGVSQSTISRELRRNAGKRGFRYKQAHEKAIDRRHAASARPRKMSQKLVKIIEGLLREQQLSPQQISGRLRLEGRGEISAERIYLHIWSDKKHGGTLYKNLRHGGKKYNKRSGKRAGRGLIPNRVGIEQRPAEANEKSRVGDFEGDTIVGANRKGAIVSLVDRKTKFTFLRLIPSASAELTSGAMINALTQMQNNLHTMTTDNGKEFADHEYIAKRLVIKFFFANPYHSWERGLNEHTNGLVRQYFPKGTDFTKLTDEQVLEFEKKLNNRPRKALGFRTPAEELLRLTGDALHY
jgi:IS30 family transposase